MVLKKETRDVINQFIIKNVKEHPSDIAKLTVSRFGISRQSVNKYIKKLIASNVLESQGKTRSTKYKLKGHEFRFNISITPNLKEDEVWRTHIKPHLPEIKKNVYDICYYGFTEMMNNIIDHSESTEATIIMKYDILEIKFLLIDFGVGIFNKIQKFLNLENPKYAILELAKGKFTTDKERHTGEGIFFTSRIFDGFDILSENIYFHGEKGSDWLADKESFNNGTAVFMDIKRDSTRTTKEVFDNYCPNEEDYGFIKTKVPVKLLKYEGEELISRSQAKRLIMRFNKFKKIVLFY